MSSSKAASVAAKSVGSRGTASKGGDRGGFLARQAKAAKKVVTEAELLTKPSISPEDVLALETATQSACTRYPVPIQG